MRKDIVQLVNLKSFVRNANLKQENLEIKNKGLEMENKPELKPIETTITCPKCKTKMDMSDLKRAIKGRIDQELDHILDDI